MEKGYIHLYTGNGKGKTTAAFGLALRAACAGKRVFVGQFVKSMRYHETDVESWTDRIHTEQFGSGCFIVKDPTEEDIRLAEQGGRRCLEILQGNEYDVVILDELTIALYYRLLDRKAVERLLAARQPSTELVITGRYAPSWLIDSADLVTEMVEVKHYYASGVAARDGIER